MKVYQIDYSRLNLWSHTDLAYIQHEKSLDPFIAYPVEKTAFEEVISNRRKFPVDRSLLLNVLKKQYENLGIALPVAEGIITDQNTINVNTTHQATICTEPLYNIYKIAYTINLSREIK